MVRRSLAALALAGACSYTPEFDDCDIACTALTDCPSGFSCGDQGLCRPNGSTGVCAVTCDRGPVSVLANGNFDAAVPVWRQAPPMPNLLCGPPQITPYSGTLAACLGGGGDNAIATLSLDIVLPPTAASAHLEGQICTTTEETEGPDQDVLSFDILDGSTVIGALGRRTNRDAPKSCSFNSFALDGALTGAPGIATLRIQSKLDVGQSTSFFVDSLTLTVACR